jgi:hypothetical protein
MEGEPMGSDQDIFANNKEDQKKEHSEIEAFEEGVKSFILQGKKKQAIRLVQDYLIDWIEVFYRMSGVF